MSAPGSAASSASRCRSSLGSFRQQLEIDRQQRHLLADVVVQLARNPGALGLLRIEQPRAEVADALVAVRSSAWPPRTCSSAWRRLALWTSSPAINAVWARTRPSAENVDPWRSQTEGSRNLTTVPAGTRASLMPQRRSCRQSTWLTFRSGLTSGCVDLFAAEAPGRRARSPRLRLLALQAAADDAVVHRRIDPGNRSVRWQHCGNLVQVLQWMEVLARAVPADQQIVNRSMAAAASRAAASSARRSAGPLRYDDREPPGSKLAGTVAAPRPAYSSELRRRRRRPRRRASDCRAGHRAGQSERAG